MFWLNQSDNENYKYLIFFWHAYTINGHHLSEGRYGLASDLKGKVVSVDSDLCSDPCFFHTFCCQAQRR